MRSWECCLGSIWDNRSIFSFLFKCRNFSRSRLRLLHISRSVSYWVRARKNTPSMRALPRKVLKAPATLGTFCENCHSKGTFVECSTNFSNFRVRAASARMCPVSFCATGAHVKGTQQSESDPGQIHCCGYILKQICYSSIQMSQFFSLAPSALAYLVLFCAGRHVQNTAFVRASFWRVLKTTL